MNQETIFTKEGIYITPQGYFRSKWNSDQQVYEGLPIDSNDIEKYLPFSVYLTQDVRVKHIFEPIWNSVIFSIIFRSNFWVEMMQELKNLPHPKWIGDTKKSINADGSDIEYLEVYNILNFNSQEKSLHGSTSHWDFHGIGYPIRTEKIAKKYYSKIGDRIPFGIEFESLAHYMNFPIKIGKISMNDEFQENKEVFSGDGNLSLFELINAITWEMSFSGVGKQRDMFLKNTLKTVKKLKNKPKKQIKK
jgi:hypothetical protein